MHACFSRLAGHRSFSTLQCEAARPAWWVNKHAVVADADVAVAALIYCTELGQTIQNPVLVTRTWTWYHVSLTTSGRQTDIAAISL